VSPKIQLHIRNITHPKDENNVNAKKYVYFFGEGRAEGSARMKSLLGSKGANLAEMVNIGIPVPPGFTITTEACTHYYIHDGGYPAGLEDELEENPLATK
jgi:pyruvate,orthophosphate dikinase